MYAPIEILLRQRKDTTEEGEVSQTSHDPPHMVTDGSLFSRQQRSAIDKMIQTYRVPNITIASQEKDYNAKARAATMTATIDDETKASELRLEAMPSDGTMPVVLP